MFLYHVTCNNSRRLVETDSKADLIQKLKDVFNIEENAIVSVALFDAMWNDYVDVGDLSELPDEGKLQATVTQTVSVAFPSSPEMAVVELSSPRYFLLFLRAGQTI